MEKILIGAITVLILLAFLPIKSAPFHMANMIPVTASISNDAEEPQTFNNLIAESIELVNSELTLAENNETGEEVKEIKQEAGDNDRGVFISIGSLVLIGILLMLPFKIN